MVAKPSPSGQDRNDGLHWPRRVVGKPVNVATDEAVIVVSSGVGREEQTDLHGERAKAPLVPWKG